ncbi:hypothetical protein HELRODRAFT_184277 [Helobdella robusta]|uniref:Peptidase M13 N-terminal domain-containing protein n=1 Tax=Helobdella robusta TaxID=6412 RepID=T1FKW7_HELRO|nr:hypothetical protein HELRODRAFT_184277 [Helobdella robusta]ESO03509.1 hypothetical protein HELRODRAFT_184277 [Helobdella robusta]
MGMSCEDYFVHTCGKWNSKIFNNTDYLKMFFVDQLEFINQKVQTLLDSRRENSKLLYMRHINSFYVSCLNPDESDYKLDVVLDKLLEITSFPKQEILPSSSSLSSPPLIESILAQIKKIFDVDVFFKLSVKPMNRRSSVNQIILGPNRRILQADQLFDMDLTSPFMEGILERYSLTAETLQRVKQLHRTLLDVTSKLF